MSISPFYLRLNCGDETEVDTRHKRSHDDEVEGQVSSRTISLIDEVVLNAVHRNLLSV